MDWLDVSLKTAWKWIYGQIYFKVLSNFQKQNKMVSMLRFTDKVFSKNDKYLD